METGLELHGFWVLRGQDETTMERDSMRNIGTEREDKGKSGSLSVYVIGFSRLPLGLFFSFLFLFSFSFLLYFSLLLFSFFLFFGSKKKETFSTCYLSLQLKYSFILKYTNTRI